MTKPTIKFHNSQTNEIVEREMSDDEFAQFEAENLKKAEKKAMEETKAVEKAALLSRLGITDDEAKLLLS